MTIEHPVHGGRVRLQLERELEGGAEYTVTLFVADARWDSVCPVSTAVEAGAPQCSAWRSDAAAPPPDWLVRYAGSMLAVLQRDHRQAPSARWPRRVLRWRADRSAG